MNKIGEPAILYRLYCEKDVEKAQQLCAYLAEILVLDCSHERLTWSHPQKELQLCLKDLDLNDTLVIEIIWNAKQEDQFWQAATKTLHSAIQDLFMEMDSRSNNEAVLVIRGMTLLYQATVNPDVAFNSIVCTEIMNETSLPYCNPGYFQTIPGGRLWLLSVPQGEHKEFVYLSLCIIAGEEKLWEELWNLMFIQKDLIVHKAFQCGRNYRRIIEYKDVDNSIASLTDSTKQILDEVDVLSHEHNIRLAKLARDYDTLLEVSLELEIQQTSLAQQQSNFSYLVGERPDKPIDNYLTQRITRFHHEVALKAEQCRHLLNGAEKATHIAQTRINEVKEQRQRRQEIWFAFLGIALAVPQILTYETVERLLNYIGIYFKSPVILSVQIILTLIIASGLAVIVWLGGKSRGK